jgi:hypothetical protein
LSEILRRSEVDEVLLMEKWCYLLLLENANGVFLKGMIKLLYECFVLLSRVMIRENELR